MLASLFLSFFAGAEVADAYSPITLAEAKAYLRVDSDDEDDLIGGLINAAAGAIESETGLACKVKTVAFTFAKFSPRLMCLRGPVLAIDSVTYIDTAGDEQTLPSDQYRVRSFAGVPVLNPATGVSWPATDSCDGAVTVTASIGHTTRADIDDRIKMAAKLLVGHWYANREAVMDGAPGEVPMTVRYLLADLRLANVA